MGTIVERARKNRSIAYNAQVVVKRGGLVHRETRTFDRRPAAQAWINKREKELAQPGALEAAKAENPTLGEAIDRYIKDSRRALGSTKAQVLRSLKTYDIAGKACSAIGSADLVALATELSAGRQPQTVSNYMSHLGAVFAVARPAWGFPLDPAVMPAAFVVTKRLGLTGKSRGRNRRPTLDELDRLMKHFAARLVRRPDSMPMQWIVAAALFTTRRQEELTTMAWSDLDEAESRILIRDMKNPGEKIGNDTWCELPEPAMSILRAMPRKKDATLPYNAETVSANFTRACALLGIEDLHFHDLRHEGVTRLFELGWSIPRVATVSGHRSWSSLKRYTHLRQTGDKYAGWPWLAVVTAPPPKPPQD